MFPKLERDEEFRDFVRFGLELSAVLGAVPYWLRVMAEDGNVASGEWVAWLREQGAEDVP